MKTLFFVLVAIIGMVHAKQYCQTVDDCTHLGADIECIYSMCESWGLCGCQRTKHMYYLGSERKFGCVPLKKIGETCSTSYDTGYCAAKNSYCKDGWCACKDDIETVGSEFYYEERWGGEACLERQMEFTFGESCTKDDQCPTSVDGIKCVHRYGSSSFDSSWGRYTTTDNTVSEHLKYLPQRPIDANVRVCGCDDGQRLTIPNEFSSAYFMGRNEPACKPIGLGDKCVRDADCSSIQMMRIEDIAGTDTNTEWNTQDADGNQAATCVDNVCTCFTNNYVADITGMYCAPGLSGGDNCAYKTAVTGDILGVCDGEAGLICGNPCTVDTYDRALDNKNYTCQCAPGWEGRGTNGPCSRVTEGSSCMGDFMCTSLHPNAWCSEGACMNGSPTVAVSILTLCLALIAAWFQRN